MFIYKNGHIFEIKIMIVKILFFKKIWSREYADILSNLETSFMGNVEPVRLHEIEQNFLLVWR